ncbi:SusD/RagB family nutrient-binding outer membrane lipoprotein [Sunxiuqinia elliptica]|uniref:Starch-binding associating with outer membrane n=1 Tax=Sunxiuqinia elliptica TaxID=655355 RepID=A0A1I2A9P4_9BACT|nr:SusD/RagB family nutrient-binding outer membrane lipoprotein [Sunxiuqinia elliptica]SFE39550.1 Starch-binding associating with outer membrane [Sunxiuqinia elliptica]
MNLKKLLYISLITLLTSTLVGCEDWLDVNRDPNNLSELSSPETVLPVAQLGIANALMGWEMGFHGAFWSQYWTQDHTSSQFKFIDQYNEDDFSITYRNLVPFALNDLKGIMARSEEGSGTYIIAEALSIYTWQIVTDTWGDIPYSEALGGEEGSFSPKFDTQESIYDDLLTRVDALLQMNFASATITSRYDFIFDGDMLKWKAFVKSLKLKLMIRLSETSKYNNADLIALAEAGGFITENAMIHGNIWNDKDGKRHPMDEFIDAGYFDNVIASRTMIEYLVVNNDPRIGKLYEPTPDGNYLGSFQGDFAYTGDTDGDGTTDDKEDFSLVSFAPTSDIPLMTTWEINFYLAEIYARANNSGEAKAYYDNAVQASMDYWEVSGSITGSGEYAEWPNGTVEENIKAIAMQKWVAYCKLQHMEAFYERNRTKYPSVSSILIKTPADRSDIHLNYPAGEFIVSIAGQGKLSGNLPASPIYPNDVVTRNTTKPSQKTSMGEKVWWDQKAGK